MTDPMIAYQNEVERVRKMRAEDPALSMIDRLEAMTRSRVFTKNEALSAMTDAARQIQKMKIELNFYHSGVYKPQQQIPDNPLPTHIAVIAGHDRLPWQ
jgi:hypothetical protein